MRTITVINPTVDSRKLRACAYARVSSDSADQENSFLAQVKHYTEFFAQSDIYEYVDIYADEGLSGLRTDKREEFLRMLKDCRKGKIDRIFTKSISRFSRNTRDCIQIIRELKSLDISVYFEKEEIDTATMTSEMMVGILGTLAQEESMSISTNMRWSYRRRMKNGSFITCKAPFGYRLDKTELTPDPYETEIVRKIFNDYLNGKGINEIAMELTTIGVPKRGGTDEWLRSTVTYILKNEKMCGNALLQKRFTTDTLPFNKMRNNGEREQYFVENSHDGIISVEMFEKVQKLMAQRSTYEKSAPNKLYPLSSKIKCSECGANFRRIIAKDNVYWICRNHWKSKDKCSIKRIEEKYINASFISLYNKLRKNMTHILYPILAELSMVQDRLNRGNKKISEINLEIAKLTEQNLALSRVHSKGYMDSALFMEQSTAINKKVVELRASRRRLLDADEDETASDTEYIIEILNDGPDMLTEFDATIFDNIVKGITAVSRNELKFILINGLELTEYLEMEEQRCQSLEISHMATDYQTAKSYPIQQEQK